MEAFGKEEGRLGYIVEDLEEYRKSRQGSIEEIENERETEPILVQDAADQGEREGNQVEEMESAQLLARINRMYSMEEEANTKSPLRKDVRSVEQDRRFRREIEGEEEAAGGIGGGKKQQKQIQLFYKFGYFVEVINQVLEFNGLTKTESSQKASLIWNPKMGNTEAFSKLLSHQKVNHFPNSLQLGRKDCLNKNIFHMQIRFPKEFNFLPRSYILPQEEPVLLEAIFFLLLDNPDKALFIFILHSEAEGQFAGEGNFRDEQHSGGEA